MPHKDLAQQTLVEHGMFKQITEALRIALDWKYEGADVSRKLSSVRFVTQSLQRHWQRLIALEEYDGYMDVVVELSPQFGKKVDALRKEHGQFSEAVHRIVHSLEGMSSTDHATFAAVCDDLRELLRKLEDHSRSETDLLQEAFEREGGGEG